MRSVYFHWSLLEHEAERVLDDLARWTNIDTLLFYAWTKTRKGDKLLLPTTDGFEDFDSPAPVVGEAAFDTFSGVLEMAKSKGFKIACHFCPLFAHSSEMLALRNEALHQPTPDELFHGDLIWGCPNNPLTIQYAIAEVRSVIKAWQSAELLQLNHVEYPVWPHTGCGVIFTCFCQHCREAAQSAGLDFAAIEGEARALLDDLTTMPSQNDSVSPPTTNAVLECILRRPMLAEWMTFRTASLTKLISTVTNAAREAAQQFNPQLKIGMDVFLPSLANVVGTDFTSLYPLFDWISPKFPDYLTGSIVPMLADQMNSTGEQARTAELRESLRQILDVGPGPSNYEPSPSHDEELFYRNTFDATIVDRQMTYLNPLKGKVQMNPWVWQYNQDLPLLQEKVSALDRNGFEGYCIWLWKHDLTTSALQESQGIF
jgi:hypothetical protein